MSKKEQQLTVLVGYLYAALSSPFGVELLTDDPKRCRMKLYEARKFALDPQLACLQLRLSPIDHRAIWITKGPENAS